MPLAPTVMGVAGIALAYSSTWSRRGIPARSRRGSAAVYLFLLNKWYFDELYDAIFVQPARRLADFFWKTGDAASSTACRTGAADLAVQVSRGAVRIQTGAGGELRLRHDHRPRRLHLLFLIGR